MFDWFNKKFSRRKYPTWADTPPPTDMEKIGSDMNKVLPFPELKTVPKAELPKEELSPKIFYRIGVTDKNRVSFQMGYSEITMTKLGVRNLIDQLELFQGQLRDETEDDDE